jgi:NifB/MoaA-like Fe-S oxidoreductase
VMARENDSWRAEWMSDRAASALLAELQRPERIG